MGTSCFAMIGIGTQNVPQPHQFELRIEGVVPLLLPLKNCNRSTHWQTCATKLGRSGSPCSGV